MPHPTTDLSKNQIASQRKTLYSKYTKTSLKKKRLTFRTFWVKEARHLERKKRKCATSIVERVLREEQSEQQSTKIDKNQLNRHREEDYEQQPTQIGELN